jgi:hypothetical protein
MISANRVLTSSTPVPPSVEDAFFTNIITSRGVWKTTQHHRLDSLNALVTAVAKRNALIPRVVMDVGISSGITTLEWIEALANAGFKVNVIATDLTLTVYLVEIAPGLRVLVEPNGFVLQVAVGGFGFRPWCSKRDYALGTFLPKRLAAAVAAARLSRLGLPLVHSAAADTERIHGPLKLVTAALRRHPGVLLMDDDLLAPNRPELTATADILRLANVVQETYFTPEQIALIVRNVRERCRGPGSLVAVCRNVDNALNGSILSLTPNGGFRLEERLGAGSEVEQAFLASV